MSLTRVRSFAGVAAAYVAITVSMSACGGDSTGPSNLDSSAALQSLQLGLAGVSDFETLPQAVTVTAFVAGSLPILDQVSVTLDGESQTMFSLGFRQSFPAGTCDEDVFSSPYNNPGECTPLKPEIGLILWQSHSASAPPDRLIIIAADVGTSDFNDFSFVGSTQDAIPAFALYLEGEDLWFASSGTLTSQVAATDQSCGFSRPPYAKAWSCSVANFDEQGAITFEFLSDTGLSTRHLNLTIPRQTIHGFWADITEPQPFTFASRSLPSHSFGR